MNCNRLFFLLLYLLCALPSYACDGCGCSISQAYFGLTPNTQGHYLGLWWQHQQYEILPDNIFPERGFGEDYFNSVEWRGRFELHPRIQVSAILPMTLHRRNRQEGVEELNGLGDAVVLINYLVFDNSDSLHLRVRHRLSAGLGTKMPTGAYRTVQSDADANPNFQRGTGSWDYLFNLAYTLRLENTGMHIEGTYRYNTANEAAYRFGNRVDIAATAYWLSAPGQVQWMPTLGLHYEQSEWNEEKGYYRTDTGGDALLANAGLEAYWQQFNLGASYSYPLAQHWNNDRIDAKSRFSIHLNYFL
jgi:hypothetical protein